jgi:hypothetical protein
MRKLVVLLVPLLSACDESVSSKGITGVYDVMITQAGKSDSDVMTVSNGSNGFLLLTFIAGITTDPNGANANGLRASLGEGGTLHLNMQPAHIDHSTGNLDGEIFGDGKIEKAMVNLTLHYLPTNFAIGTMTDGGIVLTRDAGTTKPTLDYVVTGTRE